MLSNFVNDHRANLDKDWRPVELEDLKSFLKSHPAFKDMEAKQAAQDIAERRAKIGMIKQIRRQQAADEAEKFAIWQKAEAARVEAEALTKKLTIEAQIAYGYAAGICLAAQQKVFTLEQELAASAHPAIGQFIALLDDVWWKLRVTQPTMQPASRKNSITLLNEYPEISNAPQLAAALNGVRHAREAAIALEHGDNADVPKKIAVIRDEVIEILRAIGN